MSLNVPTQCHGDHDPAKDPAECESETVHQQTCRKSRAKPRKAATFTWNLLATRQEHVANERRITGAPSTMTSSGRALSSRSEGHMAREVVVNTRSLACAVGVARRGWGCHLRNCTLVRESMGNGEGNASAPGLAALRTTHGLTGSIFRECLRVPECTAPNRDYD